ncbi:hypothetical protein B0H14DRAFT_3470269 [Mycena olivaceomarginata]|nr:hypothetical protein B0H14DRAFT_3470269 [Mycena olivaceomarginata]
MAVKCLVSIANHLVFPLSNRAKKAGQKDSTVVDWVTANIPVYDVLTGFGNLPGCARSVWGAEEKLVMVNLLTDAVVKTAASKEIKIGKPLNFPEKLMFEYKSPEINMKIQNPESSGVRDDEIHINTQSGTQWEVSPPLHFPMGFFPSRIRTKLILCMLALVSKTG